MLFDRGQIIDRRKKWEKFNAWEAAEPKAWAIADPEKMLKWYGEAWEIANKLDPGWTKQKVDLEKIQHIQRIKGAFARLGGFNEHSGT